jgi:glycosyltransferase involved in cell wall biosynthesis
MQVEMVVVDNLADQRRRYRFIYDPLVEMIGGGRLAIKLSCFTQRRGIRGVLDALRGSLKSGGPGKCIIYCGTDVAALAWLLGCRVTGNTVLLRLGGNQVETFKLLMKDALDCGRYTDLIRYLIYAMVSIVALRLADGAIVVSDTLSNRLRSKGRVKKDRPIFVVHQPVPCVEAQNPTKGASSPPNALRFLTVTNLLYNEKLAPLKTLIDAFLTDEWKRSFKNQRPIDYAIIGGGPKLDELRSFVLQRDAELAAEGVRVQILGRVDNPSPWYESADIFLYGSLHDSVPNVLLEAQAHGLPIVANALEDLVSLLNSPRNALFYRTGDSADAAVKIAFLVKSPEARQSMAESNYEDVSKRFGLAAIEAQLERVVKFCIDGPGQPCQS